jgi:hypothetical protein
MTQCDEKDQAEPKTVIYVACQTRKKEDEKEPQPGIPRLLLFSLSFLFSCAGTTDLSQPIGDT